MMMKQKGKSTLEIRNYIDNKYKEGAMENQTPTPQCQKLKKRGTYLVFFIHFFFLTNFFKCISPYLSHNIYNFSVKEGTQLQTYKRPIDKLSITRIAV